MGLVKIIVRSAVKETVKQTIKGFVLFFGIPTVAIIFLMLVILLGFYGALAIGDLNANGVVEAKDNTVKEKYIEIADLYHRVDPDSTGEQEERHRLHWGLVYAVENMFSGTIDTKNAENITKSLAPRFEYKNSTVTVVTEIQTEDGTTTTVEKYKVKLLTKADTYQGIYLYRYRQETIVTHPSDCTTITTTKEVVDGVEFIEDWARFDSTVKKYCNITNVEEIDRTLITEAGKGFTSGQENLAWLFGTSGNTISGGYVPAELLKLFKEAEKKYGVPWYVLAAIAKIESDFRANVTGPPNYTGELAQGMMQFLPSSWRMVGQDGNGDGIKNPFDPADAVYAAAYYLSLEGFMEDPRSAIYAYNHSWQYVDEVLQLAEEYRKQGVTELAGQYSWPVLGSEWRITSYFGEREQVRDYRPHNGLDIAAATGTPVIAVGDGTVIKVSTTGAGGNAITLQGQDGRIYYYAHLSEFLVRKGQEVTKGETIGKVGSTGHSTGPHLHFGVMVDGQWIDPLFMFKK